MGEFNPDTLDFHLRQLITHYVTLENIVVYGSGITAFLTAVVKGTLFLIKKSGRWWRLYVAPKTLKSAFVLKCKNPEFSEIGDLYVLIVRYGTDAYLKELASEEEKEQGRLQLRVRKCKIQRNPDGETEVVLKLPVHRKLGTQFKCFAEPKSPCRENLLAAALEEAREAKCISEIQTSHSIQRRMYFLINDRRFAQVDTIEKEYGVRSRNNFVFPE